MRLVPLGFAFATLFATGIGGLAAIRFRDRLHLLLGFSSGAVLGVAIFDLLPELFKITSGVAVMPWVAIGFSAFFALERYTAMHRAREHAHAREAHAQEFGIVVAAGLSLHSFLDGIAIGIGFQTSPSVGVLIALGVIAHDMSDGLNTVTVVLAHGNPLRRAAIWLLIDMAAPVIGAAATLAVTLDRDILGWILAFFTGSFLYIGASDLLPEAREHDSPLVGIATASGLVMIYLTTRFFRS